MGNEHKDEKEEKAMWSAIRIIAIGIVLALGMSALEQWERKQHERLRNQIQDLRAAVFVAEHFIELVGEGYRVPEETCRSLRQLDRLNVGMAAHILVKLYSRWVEDASSKGSERERRLALTRVAYQVWNTEHPDLQIGLAGLP